MRYDAFARGELTLFFEASRFPDGSRNFTMNGQLNKQPLAELIREISLERLSGTLRLQHERAKTAVYFEAGAIIYAASNVAELRLGAYLKKRELVSDKQLSKVADNRSDIALLAALNENNALDPKKVQPLIAQQVADVLRVALLWTEGTWEFDDHARLGERVRVNVETTSLLMETTRKMGLKFVSSRFSNPAELISPLPGAPDFEGLLPMEGFVLSRVESPISVQDLIALSGLRDLDATRAIYGLALGGFIEREAWPLVLRDTQRRSSQQSPATREAAGEVATEDISSASEVSGQTLQEELAQFFTRLANATNYYEILNVDPGATVEEIKLSYYSLARLYHPDRFHLEASAPLYERIESAFARIAQAYEALADATSRGNYDAKLASQEKSRQFAQSAPKAKVEKPADAVDEGVSYADIQENRAEDNFKEGFAALQQGRYKVAITHLAAAARLLPKEPRYRAYYGRALGALAETRRLAEAELQAAIKLDPDNPGYRVMLAELYLDLGFFRRAEGEIERAVSMDPHNTAARILVRKLEKARQSG